VRTLLAVTWKDLRLIARDRAALLFLVLVPFVVVTVLAEALAGSDTGSLLLPVVNEDQGPVATVLVEALAEHAKVVEVSRAEAEYLVAGKKTAPAAIVVPEHTSKNYLATRPSTLLLLTDPAKSAAVMAVKAYLMLAGRKAAEVADPLSQELLVMQERNLTGSRSSIPPAEQNVPGFSVMFVLMGVLFGVAFGLHDEREWGAITRLLGAPVSRTAILGGKLLARFLVGLLQLTLLFLYGHLVFDLSLGKAPLALALVIAAVVFCMTGFSLLVSAFTRTREQVIPLGLTVIMIFCALGGCWWPLYQMPPWLREVAKLTFTAWAMEGFHDVILRERGTLDVLPALGVLVAYGAVCVAVGARLQRLGTA
jgi:linearmycin/streptolysin S transport system permease protein